MSILQMIKNVQKDIFYLISYKNTRYRLFFTFALKPYC
jgi:hypothetical protein